MAGSEYIIYRHDRKKGAGGVLLAVSANNDKFSIIHSWSGPGESLTVTLQLSPHLIFNVSVFYRPPCEYILDNLEEIMSDNPSRYYKILLGDFNFPDIDWSAAPKCIVKPCSKRYSFHKKAIDLIKCANLKQLVHEPTHNLGNTLDLVFVEKPLFDDLSLGIRFYSQSLITIPYCLTYPRQLRHNLNQSATYLLDIISTKQTMLKLIRYLTIYMTTLYHVRMFIQHGIN